MDSNIDANELFNDNQELLKILLFDNTTKKNIIWATENYSNKGIEYMSTKPILPNLLKTKAKLLKPRIEKSKAEQIKRSKDNAEVFTPCWIVNKQNNLVDNAWFGKDDLFNDENEDGSWTPTEKVLFEGTGRTWQEYVSNVRLEMACGEAPYLVSRYDAVKGGKIEIKDRMGLLDRKLRIVNENAADDDEWLDWVKVAFKSVYGYEYQGDNLLIARENLLLTFIEYYEKRFGKEPEQKLLIEIATIISWNLWQMDGLKLVVPLSCHKEESLQLSLFADMQEEPEICKGCKTSNPKEHNGKRCYIMDWTKNKKVKYVDLLWRN